MNYYKEAQLFLTQLFEEIDKKNLKLKFIEIDHLCYRTESENHYINVCNDFFKLGELLIESEVGGRPISTFKLSTPVEFRGHKIPLVEVPAPKPGRKTDKGFEHIELVVEESFDVLIERYHKFNLITSALNKKLNPELEIELSSGAIKFHHLSLEEIIRIEKSIF